ncbi:ABC transporter ATP-binding protein [Planobispora siamensis]|uniref:ABC transporter ATP-binding protein n=1 Tax=Planobispora siamensis TaxID=936338 RepID=A0A8J3WN26_9ACTN|nr:ABC transporter ATP-binding protein [Planobispora siamensis]GIH93406.1 ABC transporter ATP-binding protein [Planobispora siamensis]
MLEARGVHKAFGPTRALRGLTVEIGEGEIVAVTGPSGSGKSTLLHCLAGILRPETGEIRFDGRRIDSLGDAARTTVRRENFGVVFQFGQLVPELSALENVALPLMFNRHGREESMLTARSWLERLGVEDCAGLRPGELSGGQAQRVAVARALVTGPRVVFADEPTGALDSLAGERVMDELTGTARESRTTLVIVTHDNRVAAYADREIVLRDGTVASAVTA